MSASAAPQPEGNGAAATTSSPPVPNVADQGASNGSSAAASSSVSDGRTQADTLVAEGKKAIALKQWEEGVQKYAEALDIMRPIVGDFDPAMAPLLLSYGKALYELAFSQAGVMGKEEVEKETQGQLDDQAGSSTLIESADPELLAADGAVEGDGDDAAGDEGDDAEAGNEDQPDGAAGEGEDEPEDDYNAAWEVLDVARTIYTKMADDAKSAAGKEGDVKEAELRLADCYEALGDVSCETENFQQAVSDYSSSLALLTPHHPSSSRAIASLHFQLGTVLDFLPSRRSEALSHVQSAITSFQDRLADLSRPADQATNPEIRDMAPAKRDSEKKEVEELIGDLEVKVEELKQAPEREDLVGEGIRHLLGGTSSAVDVGEGSSGSAAVKKDEGPVNDLSGMVKKKKKPTQPVPVPVPSTAAVQQAVSNGAQQVVQQGKDAAESVKHAVQGALETAVGVAEKVISEQANGNGESDTKAGEKRSAAEENEERDSKRTRAE